MNSGKPNLGFFWEQPKFLAKVLLERAEKGRDPQDASIGASVVFPSLARSRSPPTAAPAVPLALLSHGSESMSDCSRREGRGKPAPWAEVPRLLPRASSCQGQGFRAAAKVKGELYKSGKWNGAFLHNG